MKPKYKIPLMKEVDKIQSNGYKVVSTFSGGGGSCLGYRMSGFKVIWANEFIEEAANTYKANHKNSILDQSDIRNLQALDILNAIGMKAGEIDLFDGSPPCSAFSTAGSRDDGWGQAKKYSDKHQKNVEDLFFDYARILKGIQPKVFIAENVAGLVKGGAKGYFKQILQALRDCGYVVTAKVIDAKWLGVPQRRARLIFVGIRKDLWKPEFEGKTHPKPLSYLVTLKEAFEGLEITKEEAEYADLSNYSIFKYLKSLPFDTSHVKRYTLSKSSPHGQSFCITAQCGSRGSACASHWDNRSYTIRELKRIMSVPDDFILTGPLPKQGERLGRMVAPLMMKAVADNIISLGVLNENTL